MAIENEVVSREELVRRARSLIPTLRERAVDAEQARQIPIATVDDLRTSGLLRIPTPERYGGYDHDIDLLFQTAMEIAQGCGSTGWCYAVWSIHNWMLGYWPEEAQEEYFSTGPDTLSSSSFMPAGTLEPVDGGYRLAGRWGFSSGSEAAKWVMVGAMSPRGPVMALLPRSDYEILDTWYVSGLKGTGSNDIKIDNAFVPGHRVAPIFQAGNTTAFDLHGRASYRLPPMALLPFTLCSPLVGMAEGAINTMVERYRGKTGGGKTAESAALQLRLAESAAEADAARLLVTTTTRELIERGARGEPLTDLDQATARRRYGYVAKLCVQSVNRLFEAAGGHSLYESDPMQRIHRDVHAGSHQAALYWDSIAEGYGRAAFGLPPVNGFR